ncbi:hypothetical protein C8R45DRAFT_1216120 [Mycena sanguinolenta]|nr:hypothetical protein C8R45DRAFT_1216120 [Mycena sanguinolenta]
MARGKTVNLTTKERAICRVRYRQVATYMDPGPSPMLAKDPICKAIAAYWDEKNVDVLKKGSEYSDWLFPFGNPRAVSRHMLTEGMAYAVDADRETALAWVRTRPKNLRPRILALLGLTDTDDGSEEADTDAEVDVKDEELDATGEREIAGEDQRGAVRVKDEESDVKRETVAEGSGKRKLEEVDKSEEDTKDRVVSKRSRADATPSTVKTEAKDVSDSKGKIKDEEVAVKLDTVVGEGGKLKLEEGVKSEENAVKIKHEDLDVKRDAVADVGAKRSLRRTRRKA